MTAAAASQVASVGTPQYITAAITLAFMSGLILLAMAVLRLGFLANFLSHPVISGFITASGILIAASQLKHILGIKAEGADVSGGHVAAEGYEQVARTLAGKFNLKSVAITLRESRSADENGWSAMLLHDGKVHRSRKYDVRIVDRVGGGDSFASGVQFGFLEFNDAQKAVEYGAAHGALASTTPGDTSMATRKEVEKTIGGGGARVVR
jgi:sugar/nucleoside kinase (ribokinase family)